MENFSKKRGRPRKIPVEWLESMRGIFPDLSTERSLNNVFHITIATAALREDEERYEYLTGRKSRRVRKTILAALGRIEDPDAIREVAGYICEDRMTTSDALDFISIVRKDFGDD